jgi:hypothetical protein
MLVTFVFGSPARAASSTFIVTTTNDVGAGSLRQAILDANANPGADSIRFAIAGSGIHVITVASALPTISDPVSIDARTQPGWTSSPLIEVDQPAPTFSVNTMSVGAGGSRSTIAGLAFVNFATAIEASKAAATVEDNWVGLHASGAAGPGIADDVSNQVFGIRVGPGSSVARNVVTNGGFAGIDICTGAADVVDNRVGVGPDGAPATSTDMGIVLEQGNCGGAAVPGPTEIGTVGHGNVVGGAKEFGILVNGDAAVAGNIVGFGADRVTPNPDVYGIGTSLTSSGATIKGNFVGYSSDTGIAGTGTISDNAVGFDANTGPAPNHLGIGAQGSPGTITGNQVANSDTAGVAVLSSKFAIQGNSIYDNGGLAIDLGNEGVTANDAGDTDTGPNNLQNFPTITSVTRTPTSMILRGSLDTNPNVTATIDLYQSAACDPSGFGEGYAPRGHVDVAVPASGTATWQLAVPAQDTFGPIWTATATVSGATSEFGPCATSPSAVSTADTGGRPVVNISTTAPGTIGPPPCPGLPPSNMPATATLSRTGDLSSQLVVSYTFGATSSTATFAAGATTTVLSFQTSGTLAIVTGPNYDPGDPSSGDVSVVPPPSTACLVTTLTDTGSNSAQTIRFGQAPAALVFENVAPVSVADGALPRGLTLDADGTWSGTAQEVGTFAVTLKFCQLNCVTSRFELTVEPQDSPTASVVRRDAIPRTGGAVEPQDSSTASVVRRGALARTGGGFTIWCVAAFILIVSGIWLRRAAARHMTPPAGTAHTSH